MKKLRTPIIYCIRVLGLLLLLFPMAGWGQTFRRYGEVVLYPMLSLDNHTLDKIYHYSLTVGPALELVPWRNARGTVQLLVPIASNDRGSEQRRLRAGVNTLQQTLYFGQQCIARATVGLFTNHRSGIDLKTAYLLPIKDFFITGQVGYTGEFICDSRQQVFERWNRLTGAYGVDYLHRASRMRYEVQRIHDLNGDQQYRVDITRIFRQAAVGFYGFAIDRSYNLGFHFAIRLQRVQPRNDPRGLRVRAPYYVDWQYTMKSKSYHRGYGNYYETAPDWNHAYVFWHDLRSRQRSK